MLFLLSGCQKELTLQDKIEAQLPQLVSMAELGTVEYTVTKVVKAQDTSFWANISDRTILLSATATVKAGVDLSNFSTSNTKIDEQKKSITLTLPHVKKVTLNMPPENIELVYVKIGPFRSEFTAQERQRYLRLAERAIRKEVPQMGICAEAERNTTQLFTLMLKQIGFEEINIAFE